MSQQVNVAHLNTYQNRIELLLQQRGSKLSHTVMEESYVGKGVRALDQVGSSLAVEITGRHQPTDAADTPHDARWVFPRDFGVADFIDEEDLFRMMVNPQSKYGLSQSYALGRQKDDLIIDAMTTDVAKTGEDGEVTVTFANDGGTVVDSAGAGPMTVAKLREAKKNLMVNEVDVDHEELWVGMSAIQHDNMLAQTQAISLDYTSTPVLENGRITRFMGFNFIVSERFALDSNSDRICIAWAKSGVTVGTWNGINTRVGRREDLWGNLQIMTKGTFGATRYEGGKVVKIICDE